tara:strand:- start:993 stop:2180 length:1188 start_codon:yes stop_codon:yes gene_type:complete
MLYRQLNKLSFACIYGAIFLELFAITAIHIQIFRSISLTLLFFGLAFFTLSIFSKSQIVIKNFIFSSSYIFLIAVGLLLSIMNGGIAFFVKNPSMLLSLALSFFIAIIFLRVTNSILAGESLAAERNFVYIFYLLAIFFVAAHYFFSESAGFLLNFETADGENAYYKQQFTLGCGLAAITFINEANHKNWLASFILISLAIFFSALGGGRGDFLIIFIICLYLIFIRSQWSVRIFIISVILLSPIYIAQILTIDLLLLERMMQLGESNIRFSLLMASGNVLDENIHCMILGCGFNFFQYEQHYDWGLYPHNSLIEIWITFGILGLFLWFMAAIGVVRVISSRRFITLLSPLLALFLVSLKSSSLVGNFVLPAIFILAYIGFKEISSIFGNNRIRG